MGIIQGGGGDLFPPFPLTSIKADLAMQLPGQGLGMRPTARNQRPTFHFFLQFSPQFNCFCCLA
jgi:hypothetical protein